MAVSRTTHYGMSYEMGVSVPAKVNTNLISSLAPWPLNKIHSCNISQTVKVTVYVSYNKENDSILRFYLKRS